MLSQAQLLGYEDGIGTKMLKNTFSSDIRAQISQKLVTMAPKMVKIVSNLKMVKVIKFDHY